MLYSISHRVTDIEINLVEESEYNNDFYFNFSIPIYLTINLISNNQFSNFEQLAIGIFSEMYKLTHESIDAAMSLHIIPYYGDCILSIAYNCVCRQFIADDSLQSVLNKIWTNQLNVERETLPIIKTYINKSFFYSIKVSEVNINYTDLYKFKYEL